MFVYKFYFFWFIFLIFVIIFDMNKERFIFFNQGCRLNHAETAVLHRHLISANYVAVEDIALASIVIINTCTVTENGDKDTKRLCRKIQKQNSQAKIALIGCQAQILKEKLFDLPNVAWVIGNEDKMLLPELLKEERLLATDKIQRTSFTLPIAGIDHRHVRANLKIQDGCDFYCAFCVIPFARGPARSRVFSDLINEAKILVQAGHQELVLTGINLGTYAYESYKILDVVNALEAIDGLKRIRISSIEPTTIPKELILHMAHPESKLCRYLHIPIQSASDKILKLMNRHYSVQEYREFLNFCVATVKDVCIGTDIICGFPGEDKAAFDETVANVMTLPWHYAHVFSYSERTFARSRKLDEQVNVAEIKRRSRILQRLFAAKRLAYQARFLNQKAKVLFEQNKNGIWQGLTDHFIKITVKNDTNLRNAFHSVLIKENGSAMQGVLI